MKYLLACVAIQIFALQSTAQCLPGLPAQLLSPAIAPAIAAPAVIQAGSVANTLADTLSLLTVSSLLAEKLPLGPPLVVPAAIGGPCAPTCGCGYPYGAYVI